MMHGQTKIKSTTGLTFIKILFSLFRLILKIIITIIIKNRLCTNSIILRRFRVIILAVEKTKSMRYPESVFLALVIQRAKRMRNIVICGLPEFTTLFPTFSYKRHDLRKKSLKIKFEL